jgi:hypothetical protein
VLTKRCFEFLHEFSVLGLIVSGYQRKSVVSSAWIRFNAQVGAPIHKR